MSFKDLQRYRRVYSYYRPTPRPTDCFTIDTDFVLDALRASDWKQSVRYASTGNYDLSTGGSSLNGQTMADEDRVLLKDQADPKQNGIYVFSSAANNLTRALDAVTPHLTTGATCYVDEGANEKKYYTLTTYNVGGVVDAGNVNQTWEQVIGSGGGGSPFLQWNELTPSPRLNTTASVSIAGSLGSAYAAEDVGSNVFFFVSGSSDGSSDAVFGGGLVVSGSQVVKGTLTTSGSLYLIDEGRLIIDQEGPPGTTIGFYAFQDGLKFFGENQINFTTNFGQNFIIKNGDNTSPGWTFYSSSLNDESVLVPLLWLGHGQTDSGKFAVGLDAKNLFPGSDVSFFVSGALNGTDRAVFGGDVRVSGSIYASRNLYFPSGSILGYEGGTGDPNNDWGRIVIQGNDSVSGTPVAAIEVRGGSVDGSSAGPADAIIRGGNTSWANVDAANVRLLVGTASIAGSGRDGAVGVETSNSGIFFVSPEFNRPNNTDVNFYVSGSRESVSAFSSPVRKSLFNADVVISGSLSTYAGISGSHTSLWDGSPAFLAGPYITLRTSSLGAIEITGSAPPTTFYQWNELSPSPALNTTASITIAGAFGSSFDARTNVGSDAFFYVSGSIGGIGSDDNKAVFGGDVAVSGSLFASFLQPGPAPAKDIFIGVSGTQALGPAEGGNIYIAAQPGLSPFTPGNVFINAGNVDYPGGASTGSIYIHGGDVYITASNPTSANFYLTADKLTLGTSPGGDPWITIKASAQYFTEQGIAEDISQATWGFQGSIGANPDLKNYTIIASSSLSDPYQRGITAAIPAGQGTTFSVATFSGDLTNDPAGLTLTNVTTVDDAGSVRTAGFVTASLGFSGSLTRLTDGSSYLVASGAIEITSASNGPVTIYAPPAASVYRIGAIFSESPDGSRVNFTPPAGESFQYVSGLVSIAVYQNGIRLRETNDYSVTQAGGVGSSITFLVAPLSIDLLQCDYIRA